MGEKSYADKQLIFMTRMCYTDSRVLKEGAVMFWKRRKPASIAFDKTGKIPVIRSSICTGEQVAGFKNIASGKFEELMLICGEKDLSEFLSQYQVEESEIKREW